MSPIDFDPGSNVAYLPELSRDVNAPVFDDVRHGRVWRRPLEEREVVLESLDLRIVFLFLPFRCLRVILIAPDGAGSILQKRRKDLMRREKKPGFSRSIFL